jgi:hypothetical protein
VLEGLVERARKGDEAAFEDLTRIAGDRSMALASRIAHDPQAAERAVEAAFAVAWRTIPRLREPSGFEPWLETLVLEQCAREGGTIRRRRGGSPRGEPASLGRPALSDATLDAIGQRVARTPQLSERPLFGGSAPLRVVLLAAIFAASVVASGQVHPPAIGPAPVDATAATLPPDIVAALHRPTFTETPDGAVREGDIVPMPDFSEPVSFTVPSFPAGDGARVDIDQFGRSLIVMRSGASLIAIADQGPLPADLCRHGKGSANDALSSETAFDSWARRSTGVGVIGSGSLAIETGSILWLDITTDATCRGSFFVGPSERHRLLFVPGRNDRLLVLTGRDLSAENALSAVALELAASMRFDRPPQR